MKSRCRVAAAVSWEESVAALIGSLTATFLNDYLATV
jgi:hypothetical protein